jgi:hypothetical protein
MSNKTCDFCEREPATRGNQCQLCHALILALGVIKADWGPGEYEGLGESLRNCSFLDFKKTAVDRKAGKAANLGDMLWRLAAISGMEEDRFKIKLFSLMTSDKAELDHIAGLPGGTEAWNKRCAKVAADFTRALFEKAAKEKIEQQERDRHRYHQYQ